MPISSGIIDLNPWIWWKLDDLTPGVVADSSGHNIHGTSSSDLDYAVTGPTIDEPGMRFYAGGQVISPALGLSAWASTTITWWATAPALGGVSTAQLIWNIGDPLNRTARGVWALMASMLQDNLAVTQRGTTNVSSIQTPFPRPYWHMYAWVRDAVANTTTVSVDGGTAVSAGTTSGVVWQTTDPLLLKADTPVVLSNVAIFDKVLSQVQLQSIANKVQTWPYIVPSNQIPVIQGDTTVDLTPVLEQTTLILANQDTALPQIADTKEDTTAILGFWSGYESVTLPSLATALGNIQASMTSSFETAAGTVSRTIGDLLSWRPWDFFLPADLSGGIRCDHIEVDASLAALYGITLTITSWPEDWKWRTPDNAWSLKDLAVIRIYRGGSLIMRQGVHTTSHTISPLPDSFPFGAGQAVAEIQPSDYLITVDFHADVCGILMGSVLP